MRFVHNRSTLAAAVVAVAGISASTQAAELFISPGGGGDNTKFTSAIAAANPGDTIYVHGGTYNLTSSISISKIGTPASMYNLMAYPGETPILDFTGQSSANAGVQLTGNYWNVRGLTIQKAHDNGIHVLGSNNILDQLVARQNQDSGVQIGADSGTLYPSNNLVLNTDSYENYDPGNLGENADGFATKFTRMGTGNILRGTRSWGNSDDGYDTWKAAQPITFENCWAYGNGINIWGIGSFNGDGNGFKLGDLGAAHVLNNVIAWDNPHNGIDINGNLTGVHVFNSTSYSNDTSNWRFDENISSQILRNNISYAGGSSDVIYGPVTDDHNTWNGIPVDANDFMSLSDAIARGSRLADGSLPISGFLRLVAGSNLIDAGTNVGLPYTSTGPDVGAFEVGIPLPGDANRDGMVTISDLGDLASNWQATGANWTQGDFNFDGMVTISDLGDLASNWQAGVSGAMAGMSFQQALQMVGLGAAVVPEPMVSALVFAWLPWSLKRPRRHMRFHEKSPGI